MITLKPERMPMSFYRLAFPLAALFLLSSCATMRLERVGEEFNNASKGYLRLVRWQELDNSALAFVDEPLRADFQKRITAAEQVKVVDYRLKGMECRPQQGEGEVRVEWDYYIPPSVKVKTVTDVQKWRYLDEKDRRGWVLTTLLPEFK